MVDYKINDNNDIGRIMPKEDTLWKEYVQLEYEVSNNHHNPTKDPIKIARYNELKKHFNVTESNRAFNEAKEKIKQQIIASDESTDNSVLYAAITSFKKRNE